MNPELSLTPISPAGYLFLLCIGMLLLFLQRRYALAPLFMGGCFMTLGQVLLVGPFHFSILRIILLVGWTRVAVKKELAYFKFNQIDKALVAWTVISSLVYIFSRGASQESIIYQLGLAYDTFGTYFLLRALIRGMDDIVQAVRLLGIVILPLAVFFALEYKTGKSIFSVFGGVPDFAEIRDGRIRCQGAFRTSILAGTFAATAMPLFVGLWVHSNRRRMLAASAVIASVIIVFCSSSSGPLLAFAACITGILFWGFRYRTKIILWGVLLTVIALHMTMKTPVWFLIAYMGDWLGTGDGWHRSGLIDAAVGHFDEWWLMGTSYTADWMPTGIAIDPDNTDITNQFIAEGIRGGLLSLLLFVWLIIRCFRTIGKLTRDKVNFPAGERFIIWAMGGALVGHVASFISVTYFDQIIIFWYLLVAIIAALVLPPSEGFVKYGKNCASLTKKTANFPKRRR